MKDLLWEMKYELVRTLKHIFYVLLVLSFFAYWYAVFVLFTGIWNLYMWTDDMYALYFALSIPTFFGYFLYRIMT